jgi:hypothetical protein
LKAKYPKAYAAMIAGNSDAFIAALGAGGYGTQAWSAYTQAYNSIYHRFHDEVVSAYNATGSSSGGVVGVAALAGAGILVYLVLKHREKLP